MRARRRRVGSLRGYGNALATAQAAEFIGCVMDEIEARAA